MDPLQYPLVKSLWTSTNAVKGGLAKGRVLGAGCSPVAVALLVDDPVAVPPPPPTADVIEELRRRWEEVEDRRRQEEDRRRQEEERIRALSEELVTVKLAAGGPIPVESLPSLAGSLPSAGNSVATGLLAQKEMMRTPAQYTTLPLHPQPET
ncbi:hypothetical protein LIER_32021 [Lithospermum erythrorhizon]|uniref:Uncharacterized protein n=1 Tax=Lithospermum erythrorhizon TaxID=34254 RepID=A0AAV3RUH8_LITER